MAVFTRISRATGKQHDMEIPITQEEWRIHVFSGALIQDSFPKLSASQREFLMTGITDEEWNEMLKDQE